MRIAIGGNLRGVSMIQQVADWLSVEGHDTQNLSEGQTHDHLLDYPYPTHAVCRAVQMNVAELGVLVCGSGMGMATVANKYDGIRAVLVSDGINAQRARAHLDANVLCLSSELMGAHETKQVVRVFVNTAYDAGRHDRRLAQIRAIEQGLPPEQWRKVNQDDHAMKIND